MPFESEIREHRPAMIEQNLGQYQLCALCEMSKIAFWRFVLHDSEIWTLNISQTEMAFSSNYCNNMFTIQQSDHVFIKHNQNFTAFCTLIVFICASIPLWQMALFHFHRQQMLWSTLKLNTSNRNQWALTEIALFCRHQYVLCLVVRS